MLSNPTQNLHQRQRQHRRQQSTPTAFEATKVPALPNIQKHVSHRRGISLDQRQQRRQSPQQDNNTVSYTNQGFQQTQQHQLRETQQQRLVRPGHQQQVIYHGHPNDGGYLMSPIISPQTSAFQATYASIPIMAPESFSAYQSYGGQMNPDLRMYANDCPGGSPFEQAQFVNSSGLPSPFSSSYGDYPAGLEVSAEPQGLGLTVPGSRPSSSRSCRRPSGGIADRVAMFEGMGASSSSRPITPQSQNDSTFFLPTPAHTPFNGHVKTEEDLQRQLEVYDSSFEDTIRPPRSQSNQRARSIFQDMREQSEMRQAQASMATAPMPTSAQFDSAPIPSADFMNMSNLKLEFMKYGPGYESSQVSPSMSNLSPEMSDYSSPAMPTGQHFGNPFQSKPILEHAGPSTPSPESETDEGSPSPSSNRRSMTIDGIDLQETITDTGITLEEISMYIGDPDPVDQKWTCLFPECGKRFGRKENIKSHVQTHLGDRQYQCPHCHKCFVRQHDLKRHAKIHSGVKPYPCMCGNSFARHDALTRHRQRGMCIGAFEGIVKKVVKRGRPRKPRPDGDERREKKTRMRSKNKSISSGSSCSGASDSSGLSPPADLDAYLSTDYQDTPITSQGSFNYASASSPAPIDYVSPAAIQTAASPSAFSIHTPSESHYSFHSHASPPPMSSPERNSSSRHNTPPPLCLSSSSPAPSQNYLCDIPEADITPLDFSKFDQNMGMGDGQDCLFVDSFNDMGATRLEQDPSLLLLGGKFDDAFGDWDNWGMMAQ